MQIFSFSKHSFNTHYVSGLEIGPLFDGLTRLRPGLQLNRPARPGPTTKKLFSVDMNIFTKDNNDHVTDDQRH